jgi:AbrB family looped-hinge helix DNA binding protein
LKWRLNNFCWHKRNDKKKGIAFSEILNIIISKSMRLDMKNKTYCELKDRSQVTIPKYLVKKLNLQTGDMIEVKESKGVIYLIPSVVLPKDQSWFFSEKWQTEEKQVTKELKQGKGIPISKKSDLAKIFTSDKE